MDDSLNRCFDHIKLGGDPKAHRGMLRTLFLLAFPGRPWISSKGAKGGDWGKGSLEMFL